LHKQAGLARRFAPPDCRRRIRPSAAGIREVFLRAFVSWWLDFPEMFRESLQARTTRLKKIITGFQKTYPEAHCELIFANPLQLLVATILSAQCTDKRVNIVTPDLFRKYRSAEDFAEAPRAELERAIKSTGFYRNKAKNIQSCCRKLVEQHGGEVPRTMEELIQLGGVGRKTANVVLGNAFGVVVGVIVDTHAMRLSRRLGLTKEKTPEKIERDLMRLLPRSHWLLFSHWLVWHGRRRCFARKPDCANCEVLKLCPQIGVKKR
jgi:endonuclease-3